MKDSQLTLCKSIRCRTVLYIKLFYLWSQMNFADGIWYEKPRTTLVQENWWRVDIVSISFKLNDDDDGTSAICEQTDIHDALQQRRAVKIQCNNRHRLHWVDWVFRSGKTARQTDTLRHGIVSRRRSGVADNAWQSVCIVIVCWLPDSNNNNRRRCL